LLKYSLPTGDVKNQVVIKILLLDFFPSSGFLEPAAFWKVSPFMWSGEHEACRFGPRVEELLNIIQQYMTGLKKCNEGQNAKE